MPRERKTFHNYHHDLKFDNTPLLRSIDFNAAEELTQSWCLECFQADLLGRTRCIAKGILAQ